MFNALELSDDYKFYAFTRGNFLFGNDGRKFV